MNIHDECFQNGTLKGSPATALITASRGISVVAEIDVLPSGFYETTFHVLQRGEKTHTGDLAYCLGVASGIVGREKA